MSRKPQQEDKQVRAIGIDDSPTGSLGEVVKLMGPPAHVAIGTNYGF